MEVSSIILGAFGALSRLIELTSKSQREGSEDLQIWASLFQESLEGLKDLQSDGASQPLAQVIARCLRIVAELSEIEAQRRRFPLTRSDERKQKLKDFQESVMLLRHIEQQ